MTGTNEAISERLEALAENAERLQTLAQEMQHDSPDGRAARAMLARASELETEDPEEASRLRARAAEILA